MNAVECQTWGMLRVDTPFTPFFPDRQVPLQSILPIIPREAGSHKTGRKVLLSQLKKQEDKVEGWVR